MDLDNYCKKCNTLAVKGYLEENNVPYSFDEESDVFLFPGIVGCLKTVYYSIKIFNYGLLIKARLPIGPEEDDQRMMMKFKNFITGANYGLINGCFEMDTMDGEVNYRCFVNCKDTEPTFGMIKDSILMPACMLEKYGKGFLAILSDSMSSDAALELCQGGHSHDPLDDSVVDSMSAEDVGGDMEYVEDLEESGKEEVSDNSDTDEFIDEETMEEIRRFFRTYRQE